MKHLIYLAPLLYATEVRCDLTKLTTDVWPFTCYHNHLTPRCTIIPMLYQANRFREIKQHVQSNTASKVTEPGCKHLSILYCILTPCLKSLVNKYTLQITSLVQVLGEVGSFSVAKRNNSDPRMMSQKHSFSNPQYQSFSTVFTNCLSCAKCYPEIWGHSSEQPCPHRVHITGETTHKHVKYQ